MLCLSEENRGFSNFFRNINSECSRAFPIERIYDNMKWNRNIFDRRLGDSKEKRVMLLNINARCNWK